MAVGGDTEIDEAQARHSASVGKYGRIPLKERTQSPGKYLLSPNDDGFERRQARLARAAATQKRRSLAFVDSLEEPEAPPAAAAPKPGILTGTQVQELLNNCIKLAAENKINQQNTWDLQLIDYLSDIVKADSKEDTQTNFQKVSCTLEASAKIYSCRVDSVHSETYKVLGGLNRTTASGKDAAPEDAENGNGKGHSGEQEVRKKDNHRKTLDHSATLESYESLNVKHFEVSLNVDPLFHQTSAQFDEGGAKGLLLNTLSVYRGCEILFDSCDVPEKCMKMDLPHDPPTIDLSFMSEAVMEMITCREKEIAPSLREIVSLLDDPLRKAAEAEANTLQAEETVSWFNDAADDDGDVYDDPPADYMPDETFENPEPEPTTWAANSPFEDTDETFQENGAGEDLSEGEDAIDWLIEGMGISKKKNSWAGPGHWKFMKPKVSDLPPKTPKETKRKKKEPFSLDYTCIPEFDASVLAKPRDLRANLLPQARQPVSTTLPEDLHYQAEDLLRLFLRPSVTCIAGRRRKTGFSKSREGFGTPGGLYDNDADNSFGDGGDWDGDDGCHSDVENNFDGLVAQPRKVQKIEIDYDRTSKQVDVRALKQSLWEHLQEASEDARIPEAQQEEVHFSKVFSKVPESCPAAAAEDISVHLCFICLLHLANEHNLDIQGCPTMDELIIRNVQH